MSSGEHRLESLEYRQVNVECIMMHGSFKLRRSDCNAVTLCKWGRLSGLRYRIKSS